MSSTLQITADLTLHHESGDVKVQHDHEGNLVAHFPNRKTFNALLKSRLPSGKSAGQVLRKYNTSLYKHHQPVILRVRDEDWIVLGRSEKPEVKYTKVAVPYLAHTFSWKPAIYAVGSGISTALLYLFIKKRS